MTKEEAMKKVKGYLTDSLPQEEYDEVEEIIEALEPPKWIPCDGRLPEENEFYLASIYSKGMQTAFCDILFYGSPQLYGDMKIGWYFMHDNGNVEQVFNVKAWMPVPVPYAEN